MGNVEPTSTVLDSKNSKDDCDADAEEAGKGVAQKNISSRNEHLQELKGESQNEHRERYLNAPAKGDHAG